MVLQINRTLQIIAVPIFLLSSACAMSPGDTASQRHIDDARCIDIPHRLEPFRESMVQSYDNGDMSGYRNAVEGFVAVCDEWSAPRSSGEQCFKRLNDQAVSRRVDALCLEAYGFFSNLKRQSQQ